MKTSKSLIAALMLAGGALGAQASAADISTAPQQINLLDGAAAFTTLYTGNNSGNTFSDRYSFDASAMETLGASLESLSGTAKNGLDITAVALYGTSGLVQMATQVSTGVLDRWTLSAANLALDNYYLVVTGSVLSQAAGKYDLKVDAGIAPVPEPETYAMMLGGLGLLGFMSRRRKGARA